MYVMNRTRRIEYLTNPVTLHTSYVVAVAENKDTLIKLLAEIKKATIDKQRHVEDSIEYNAYDIDKNTETDLYFRCMKYNVRDTHRELSLRAVYEYHIHEYNTPYAGEITPDIVNDVIDGNFIMLK